MGRVKDMCMENEEKFYDLVGDLVRECDSVKACKEKADLDLVNHLSEKDVADIIFDMWTDYWSKYIPR